MSALPLSDGWVEKVEERGTKRSQKWAGKIVFLRKNKDNITNRATKKKIVVV